MTKYVFIYHGSGEMPESPEGVAEVMAAWNNWFGQLGEAIVDGGNPFGPSQTVGAGGSVSGGNVAQLSGYSIVNAADLDAATAMAQACPVLHGGGSVSVMETIDM